MSDTHIQARPRGKNKAGICALHTHALYMHAPYIHAIQYMYHTYMTVHTGQSWNARLHRCEQYAKAEQSSDANMPRHVHTQGGQICASSQMQALRCKLRQA